MIAGPFKDRADTVRHPAGTDEGVLPVAAIYGANASGKTNVVLAMRFMGSVVRDSHARWEPDKPIRLEPFAGQSDTPSTFSVDFLLGGVRYQYGFSLTPQAVVEEWMYAYPSGKKQTWFKRERNKPISFSTKLQGDNRAIERLTRPNSLFLSAAAQNNHQALLPIYFWFSHSLSYMTDRRSLTYAHKRALYNSPDLRERLARMLLLADLGITDLGVREVDATAQTKSPLMQAANYLAFEPEREVQFLHRIGESTLPFDEAQESKGTIAFLCVLQPVLQALKNGGVAFVDELDESLHPLLAIEVIRQFSDTASNPAGAQLIFNTHDTNLLGAGVLRRDEIWFTEKRQDGASQLYPLTDFKPRKQEDLANGYLQGRYGAIPFLNSDSFLKDRHEEER
jgi:hypothetical protein